jgi:hypothetical protein
LELLNKELVRLDSIIQVFKVKSKRVLLEQLNELDAGTLDPEDYPYFPNAPDESYIKENGIVFFKQVLNKSSLYLDKMAEYVEKGLQVATKWKESEVILEQVLTKELEDIILNMESQSYDKVDMIKESAEKWSESSVNHLISRKIIEGSV